MGVTLSDVFTTLNANMGSVYINQFNEFGRIWQVNVQAEGEFRDERREPASCCRSATARARWCRLAR